MKSRHSKALTVALSVLFAAWTATACVGGKVFDEYEQIPVEGWDKTDTLTFSVPAVAADGVYNLALGLRTTGDYPFMSLTLLFEANIIAKKAENISYGTAPERLSRTLSCPLVSSRGRSQGQGVSLYQYNFHVATISLREGDSLQVNIRHNMKREMLPGLSDLGLSITRNRH